MSSSNKLEESNIDIIYEYTRNVYGLVNDSANKLDTKLGIVIGFSGVLLRFVDDLDDYNRGLIIVKILICSSLVGSVVCSVIGLSPRASGDAVSPRELRMDFYDTSAEECRRYIVDNLINAIEQVDKSRDTKGTWLTRAIWALAIGAVLFGIEIAIHPLIEKYGISHAVWSSTSCFLLG